MRIDYTCPECDAQATTTSPGPGPGGQRDLTVVIVPHVPGCPRAARLAWLRGGEHEKAGR